MDSDDYYSILQIDAGATMEEVRAAYKRLALLHHPDRSKHPQANERMQRVNAAYTVLSDVEKRARYDLERIFRTVQEAAETQPIHAQQPSVGQTYSPEQEPVDQRPFSDHQTRPDPEMQKEQRRKRERWLWTQLMWILRLIFIIIFLFVSSLANGQVNFIIILLLISLSIYITATMILRVRNLVK
jgi:curved DNA-binding protein CbpA